MQAIVSEVIWFGVAFVGLVLGGLVVQLFSRGRR